MAASGSPSGACGLGRSVSWSPDGRAGHRELGRHRQGVGGGGVSESLTLNGHAGWINAVTWSPDGKSLAMENATAQRVRDADGGRELLVLKGHAGQVIAVAWSPDGKSLAMGGTDRRGEVVGRPRRPRGPGTQGSSAADQCRLVVARRQ